MLYRTSKSLPLALVAALWVVPATVRAQDDDLGEPIEVEAGDGGSDEDPPQEPIEVSADEQDGGETTGDADEEAASDTPEEPPEPIDVSIFGDSREVPRVAGSAHRIDEEALERFEDDNIENVLTRSAAGVYVRGEDGYGLRPNIGLRGANSDRSKKVTLMEDGVLLAPAPYSAPAAYYFPLTTRLTAVEVFKGPSAIRFGPNTIGGAVNLVTRRVPGLGHVFGADLAYGTENYAKGHGYYGYGDKHWGILVEAARLRSDGFKRVDLAERNGDLNTGFDKMEMMLKARVNTDPDESIFHQGEVKLGYAREVSNETYLGLTDADFAVDPFRRYVASARDRMEWNRFLAEVSYGLAVGTDFRMRVTGYRHDFSRAWFKVNGFEGAQPLGDILAEPTGGQRAIFYGVLSGARDSEQETLLIGTNDRTFVSQGIQATSQWRLPDLGPINQRLRIGARIHHDQINRLHTEDAFGIRGGVVTPTGRPRATVISNVGSAVAFAGSLVDEIAFYDFLIAPGIRFEHIQTTLEDRQSGLVVDGTQNVLLPGVGIIYQPIDVLAFVAGVHQGFSPVSPGQPSNVTPEVAVNYEGGARFTLAQRVGSHIRAEVIGFFSDYSNITGDCTFSSGCLEQNIDQQFNGGEANIFGLEATADALIVTPVDLQVPITASYTLTKTELLTAFTSDNPQLGEVQPGDELPYIPLHQLGATTGLEHPGWGGFALGVTYVDAMRESAGQGDEGLFTDSRVVFDLSANAKLLPELSVYGKIENLLDNHYILSRRPFGARPGRPRFFYAGVKIDID